MDIDNDSQKPIYIQVAEAIQDAIVTGAFEEETQIPSTTEISLGYRINPATVLKGMNLLVDSKVLYKKRGLGMFVSPGAKEMVRQMRSDEFILNFVKPLVEEGRKLELSNDRMMALVAKEINA